MLDFLDNGNLTSIYIKGSNGDIHRNGLVEQPAIALFDSLDWDTETCWDEAFGDAEGDLAFGRETRNDIVLTNVFARLYLS
ncbi:hypothetical protein [Vibrio aestuarianus]|uniref:hypothetical protein n=1 Tax=Vibrio aestuarianus TaxID=28171 RepID=UPI00237C99F9|nr:hypothetical protein [Vibrio aestuarianus]MDE1286770.1 hypothetical protein [Vibrio aestuarianus]